MNKLRYYSTLSAYDLKNDNTDEALNNATIAFEFNKNNVSAVLFLLRLKYKSNSIDKHSMTLIDRVHEIYPSNDNISLLRAAIYLDLGKFEKAHDFFSEITIDPHSFVKDYLMFNTEKIINLEGVDPKLQDIYLTQVRNDLIDIWFELRRIPRIKTIMLERKANN
jgi:tetratricopeptide (TPR) repeat protein